MASCFEELFGKNLVVTAGADASANKTIATSEAFIGRKQVALYFSAHWCPPCRGFTPELVKKYQELNKNGNVLEIVFVSGDKDRAAFKSYHDEMCWLTLPYADRAREKALSKKFKVSGVPTLVVLDSKGQLVSTKGRTFVSGDAEFPWTPPTVTKALGEFLIRTDESGKIEKVTVQDAFKGKNVALYFSAHWCPPCRGFTPKFAETYKKMKAQVAAGTRKDDFEIVFVSSDRDQKAFDEYFATMPWLALPYDNRSGKSDLSSIFDVGGIPTVITMDGEDFTVINKTARGSASGDPEGKEFPWYPKPVNDVNDVTDGLNDEVCVIVLLDGASDTDKASRIADINGVAKKYYDAAKAKKTDPKYRFFIEAAKGGVSGQIRSLCSAGDGAKTVLLTLGDEGSYYNANKEGDVAGLLAEFEGAKLTKKQVKK